ncbi:MAG: IS630 family transposase [Stigonema ocellatum SAG 48.90 = DSM 106950]|nr:IS630 family transposase [Stigonema ocellatum SAG 48.90 = DSM 106950]
MGEYVINRTFQLETRQLDLDLWQKLYYKYQKDYVRKRLLAIKYLCEGKNRTEVSEIIGCSYKTLSTWIEKFFSGGLDELVKGITHQVPSRLSWEQRLELKRMLLEERPTDYGIDRNIWTGKIISSVIESRWGIQLKTTRIYEILDELKLSYQKAHRDYDNADEEQQKIFVSTLKKKLELKQEKEKIVFFDEFAVYDRPSIFYGWAEKNTRPQVPSNEKGRRNKLNGMIAVDAVTGEEYLKLTEKSKTEDVSNYFALLASDCVKQGVKKLSVILDNNSTHKQKMKTQLQFHLINLKIHDRITVEFIHTPAYSPDFNLAEYIIHLVRLQLLHHLPLGANIQQVREKLENYFQHFHLQTPQQIQNIIQHIFSQVVST